MIQGAIRLLPALVTISVGADIRLSGTVYDDVGNPVFGAKVGLVRAGDKAYTDPKGEWRLEGKRDAVVMSTASIDTLLVTWKDTARAKFPITTYIQTGSVQILRTVHLGDAPASGTPAPVVEEIPSRYSYTTESNGGPLQVQGPYGPIAVPEDQAEAMIASYRKSAKIMRTVDNVFIVGGLVTAGVGGAMALGGWAADSDDLLLWGAVTGACGLIFAVVPLGNSHADEMDGNANDLQRQLDERRHSRADLRILPILDRHARAGLAMRLEF